MINTEAAFTHLGLHTTCATAAVQLARDKLGDNVSTILSKSVEMIHNVLGLDVTFANAREARLVACKAIELAVQANHIIEDPEALVATAREKITKFLGNPDNAWMWAEAEASPGVATTQVAVVEGLDTKVAVKADGSIKKGGKQVLVAEMYKKNVLEAETPMSNQQFIALVVKELKMSKAGATTYAYNAKKELGEPEGGIVKAKKGRKAKAA
jgi:hypothetical protein